MAQRSAARVLPLLQRTLGLWPQQVLGQQLSTSAAPRADAAPSAGGLRGVPGDVPAGHLRSDLSSAVCHIGLNRRRDLTMRQDIGLWQGAKRLSLEEVFKGKKIVVVGFPGGRICSEQHIPGYMQAAKEITKQHIDGVLLVTVAQEGEDPSAVLLATGPTEKVSLVSDRNAGFMKLLGLDLAPPEASGGKPRCQRFAAIVDDGILVKLKVEKTPGELMVSDAQSMVQLINAIYVD